MANNELKEITDVLMPESFEGVVPGEKLRKWMVSDDIEVLGAVFRLLHKKDRYTQIQPPLGFADYHIFHLHYYERCILENPDGEWSDSRYLAAHSFVAWFKGTWNDKTVPRLAFGEMKSFLEQLYKNGSEEIRTCIVTGILEHLFEESEIFHFFSDWKDDSRLKSAYEEASSYAGR
jgi:hypothetical protein